MMNSVQAVLIALSFLYMGCTILPKKDSLNDANENSTDKDENPSNQKQNSDDESNSVRRAEKLKSNFEAIRPFAEAHEIYKHFLFRANIGTSYDARWENCALMWYEHTKAFAIFFTPAVDTKTENSKFQKKLFIISEDPKEMREAFVLAYKRSLTEADTIVITSPPDSGIDEILLTILNHLSEIQPQHTIIFPDWDWKRGSATYFLSFLESTYYVGQSENLENIQCWKTKAPTSMDYIIFHSGGYLGIEFRKNYWNEKEAREFIVQPNSKGLFHYRTPKANDQKTLVNGCGKYVQKKNGCIYFAAWPIELGAHYVKHSFLNQGMPVLNAGYALFKEGKLVCIDSWTGHYQSRSMKATMEYFKEFNLEVNGCKVQEQMKECGKSNPPLRVPLR